MRLFRLSMPACALAAALSLPISPAGAASASGEISNLTIELIDLDTNDGITPWIDYMLIDYVSNARHNDTLEELFWYGSTTLLRPNGEAVGTSGENVLRSHARLWNGGDSGQELFSSVGWHGRIFTFSPNTLLKLNATVTLDAHSGANELAEARATFQGTNGVDSGSTGREQFYDSFKSTLGTRTFDYAVTLSTDARVGSASLYWNTYTVVQTTAAVPPPVPEPQTYAMLLAGAALIGAAHRRRHGRRAQAAG